jgi:hypothetical protein
MRGTCAPGTFDPRSFSYAPKTAGDFGRILEVLVGRAKGAVRALEVWNEPDHKDRFYLAGPDPAKNYARMLKAAYASVKKADRTVQVLGGAIVGANGNFLRALYQEGIKGHYDALSVHYYDLVLASIRAIRAVQRKAGDHTPLWLSEFGWTTCLPAATQGGHACVSPAQQASDLDDIYRAVAHSSFVRGLIVYTLQDTAQYSFGVVSATNEPKPSFAALSTTFASPRAARHPTLSVKRSGGRYVATGTGPAGDFLEVDVFEGSRFRSKVFFRPDRSQHFRIRLPSFVRSGMRVQVYQYWLGRSRGATRVVH